MTRFRSMFRKIATSSMLVLLLSTSTVEHVKATGTENTTPAPLPIASPRHN